MGFEPTISADERPKTYVLDRAAIGTGDLTLIDKLLMRVNRMDAYYHEHLLLYEGDIYVQIGNSELWNRQDAKRP